MPIIAAALKPRSVLMATDFSEASEKALRHSRAIARFYRSKLCFVHVVSSLALSLAGPGAIAACEEAASREAEALEDSVLRTGALSDAPQKVIVRHGVLWPQLREVMQQEGTDLIVVGTRGRRGISKLFFGSVAEEILRKAECAVLTFGPYSHERSWVGSSSANRTFLFATDFGQASLGGLPQAFAAASHFGAKLVLLSVVPDVPLSHSRYWYTAAHKRQYQEAAHTRTLRQLQALARTSMIDVKPDFHAEVASRDRISDAILDAADRLRADLIIMGLHHSPHAEVISHLDLATAYDVVCCADSPVLTVTAPSQASDFRLSASSARNASVSETDLIRMHGLGVNW